MVIKVVIEAINGHHDGLIGYNYLETYLKHSLLEDKPVVCNGGKNAALTGQKQYKQSVRYFCDFPEFLSEDQKIEKMKKRKEINESMYFNVTYPYVIFLFSRC